MASGAGLLLEDSVADTAAAPLPLPRQVINALSRRVLATFPVGGSDGVG